PCSCHPLKELSKHLERVSPRTRGDDLSFSKDSRILHTFPLEDRGPECGGDTPWEPVFRRCPSQSKSHHQTCRIFCKLSPPYLWRQWRTELIVLASTFS